MACRAATVRVVRGLGFAVGTVRAGTRSFCPGVSTLVSASPFAVASRVARIL